MRETRLFSDRGRKKFLPTEKTLGARRGRRTEVHPCVVKESHLGFTVLMKGGDYLGTPKFSPSIQSNQEMVWEPKFFSLVTESLDSGNRE